MIRKGPRLPLRHLWLFILDYPPRHLMANRSPPIFPWEHPGIILIWAKGLPLGVSLLAVRPALLPGLALYLRPALLPGLALYLRPALLPGLALYLRPALLPGLALLPRLALYLRPALLSLRAGLLNLRMASTITEDIPGRHRILCLVITEHAPLHQELVQGSAGCQIFRPTRVLRRLSQRIEERTRTRVLLLP